MHFVRHPKYYLCQLDFFFCCCLFVVASESSFFRDVIRNTAAWSMCGCRDKPTLLPHLCNHRPFSTCSYWGSTSNAHALIRKKKKIPTQL
ncbi:hypothetical protein BKA57DRAFT_19780 [Linnemannia elongata]|nr:hypothetical protein BKA57DRAFT_19780 [Linnemannia elongata]